MSQARITNLILIIIFLLLVFGVQLASAQSGVFVTNQSAIYNFGENITFEATITSSVPIQEVSVLFRSAGENDTQVNPAAARANSQYYLFYDLNSHPSPPAFTTITYWFHVTLTNGEQVQSQEFTVFYEDNRFVWQTLENPPFTVHWNQGDLAFAQTVLDAAHNGVQHTQQFITLAPPTNINIYVYANATDLRDALQLAALNWVAGHADPGLGVVLVSIPPGPEQNLEIERQVPHEITHIMLYQSIGPGYTNIPVWLNEGIASVSELYPNPDYRQSLDSAHQKNALIPLTSLCDTFPTDAASAVLAYAESTAFVRYLHQQHGPGGLLNLVSHYATGPGCDNGTQAVFGSPLSQMDLQWRSAEFTQNPTPSSLGSFLPWVGLLFIPIAVLLGIILLSSERTPINQ